MPSFENQPDAAGTNNVKKFIASCQAGAKQIPFGQNLRRIPSHGDEAELPPRILIQDFDRVQPRERDVDAPARDGARGRRGSEAAARPAHARGRALHALVSQRVRRDDGNAAGL